jgi:serine/threonine protein kinase
MGLARGVRLGPYEILDPLGAGGMGDVHLAEDTTLERRVALKLLSRSGAFALDEERTQRFLREARLASALSHPNIAQIFEIGDAGDVRFIAMEYVEARRFATTRRADHFHLPTSSTSPCSASTRSRRLMAKASFIAT